MAGSKERTAAEARFAEAQKPFAKPVPATTEQEEASRAVDEKTLRLKAQRLGKEQADKQGLKDKGPKS